jgi:uncharacterized protein (DUF2141 family)
MIRSKERANRMLMRSMAVAVAGLSLLACGGLSHAATLTVTVENVRNAKGEIRLSVFSSAAEWPDHPAPGHGQDLPAVAGKVVFRFEVPPGVYAAAGFHDENGNGKFDTSWIGLPEEGYMISNNARPLFSAPSFKAASFTVPPEGAAISMRIVYP